MIQTIKLNDNSTETVKRNGENSIIYSALSIFEGRLQADALIIKIYFIWLRKILHQQQPI